MILLVARSCGVGLADKQVAIGVKDSQQPTDSAGRRVGLERQPPTIIGSWPLEPDTQCR